MVDRLTRTELTVLLRSFGATRQLSPDDIRRVLDEIELITGELDRLRALVAELAAPWSMVRSSMSALYRASTLRDPSMRERLRALSIPWRDLRRIVGELISEGQEHPSGGPT